MNLSTVLRIIVSCLLNAVVAWTVDYYATSLLSRRDVFKTGRKPKIFTVQWLAFTLMLCGFALLCAVLEMLLPEGTMKRYAHFACALGLTAAMMRQLLRVIHLIAENLP